jgi:hypothetical protein
MIELRSVSKSFDRGAVIWLSARIFLVGILMAGKCFKFGEGFGWLVRYR